MNIDVKKTAAGLIILSIPTVTENRLKHKTDFSFNAGISNPQLIIKKFTKTASVRIVNSNSI